MAKWGWSRWRPRLSGLQSVQLAVPPERRVAHGLLQRPERRQVLGRAPGDETRAVAVAPEFDRQRPDETAGQTVQQLRREPCEPGAAGQGKEARGAEAQDGDDACGPLRSASLFGSGLAKEAMSPRSEALKAPAIVSSV